uniref:Uncharacterized protein n=1 Tax=Photinus pyralis TaxID=7054 RepID=A0A1Y1K4Z5_PHOPY
MLLLKFDFDSDIKMRAECGIPGVGTGESLGPEALYKCQMRHVCQISTQVWPKDRPTLLALRMTSGQKKQDTVNYALELYHVAPIPKRHPIHLTALDPNSRVPRSEIHLDRRSDS